MSIEHLPQKTTEGKVLHSGKLEGDLHESPAVEFDKTTLRQAVDQELVKLPSVEAEKQRKKKRNILIASVAGAALAVGIGGGLVAANQAPDNEPVATAPADPNQEPGTGEEEPATPAEQGEVTMESILNNPDRVAPEEIAAMSPQELSEFAATTVEEAPTPEAFAKQYLIIQDLWQNAGNTAEEFEPYRNAAKGVFEGAMGEKYDSIFTEAIYAPGVQSSGNVEGHNATINAAGVSRLIDSEIPYIVGSQLIDIEVPGGETSTENGFTMIIHFAFANNPEESGITEIVPGRTNILSEHSEEITVVNINGKLAIANVTVLK